MKKRKLVKVCAAVACVIISSSISVYANETDSKQSVSAFPGYQIFNEQEVDGIIEECNELPVYADTKTNTTALSDSNLKMISPNIRYSKTSGSYPTRKGVILVTPDKYKGIIPTGHAAIIYASDVVVESLQNGVTTGNNNWNRTKNKVYGVTVKSTTIKQDRAVADWCYKQIGKPYNWNYLNSGTRSKFYCSQLVYAGFKDNCNVNLNTWRFGTAVHPMELVQTSKTSTIYYYSK